LVADAVNAQATLGLEHLHSCCRPRAIDTKPVVPASESEPLEPLLQVNDGLSGVAFVKWQEVFA
jgi:hypothetical protein